MAKVSRCQPLLGTLVEVNIEADASDHETLQASTAALTEINRIHGLMSFHEPQSELSLINHKAHLRPIKVSSDLYQVLKLAKEMHQQTDSIFDPSVAPLLVRDGYLPEIETAEQLQPNLAGMQLENQCVYFQCRLHLDLGGLAKGYAVDRAMQSLSESLDGKLKQASVNAGGDIKVWHWQGFEVMIPDTQKNLTPIVMQNAAIATSSSYYLAGNSAIYAPESGQQVSLRDSVSVFAAHCMVADALTKVASQVTSDHPIFAANDAQVVHS